MKKKALILICAGMLALAGAGTARAVSPVILAGAGKTAEDPKTAVTAAPTEVPADETPSAADGSSAEKDSVSPNDPDTAENENVSGSICVCGQILDNDGESVTIDNVSSRFAAGEVIVTVDPETAALVDSMSGWPVGLDAFETGDFVYAYIGDAMTLSLPPIVNAQVLLTQPAEGSGAPVFGQVQTVQTADNGELRVALTGGENYLLSEACEIRPYRTRNIVTAEDIHAGSTLLIWADEENRAGRIVLFAE